MSDGQAVLETYDRDGALVRTVAMKRDEQDTTKWLLVETIALGGVHAESAVIRFGDGTSEPLARSMFSSTAPINTIFLSGELRRRAAALEVRASRARDWGRAGEGREQRGETGCEPVSHVPGARARRSG